MTCSLPTPRRGPEAGMVQTLGWWQGTPHGVPSVPAESPFTYRPVEPLWYEHQRDFLFYYARFVNTSKIIMPNRCVQSRSVRGRHSETPVSVSQSSSVPVFFGQPQVWPREHFGSLCLLLRSPSLGDRDGDSANRRFHHGDGGLSIPPWRRIWESSWIVVYNYVYGDNVRAAYITVLGGHCVRCVALFESADVVTAVTFVPGEGAASRDCIIMCYYTRRGHGFVWLRLPGCVYVFVCGLNPFFVRPRIRDGFTLWWYIWPAFEVVV
jgi:hypothetical protein